jgi:hypothetical protein
MRRLLKERQTVIFIERHKENLLRGASGQRLKTSIGYSYKTYKSKTSKYKLSQLLNVPSLKTSQIQNVPNKKPSQASNVPTIKSPTLKRTSYKTSQAQKRPKYKTPKASKGPKHPQHPNQKTRQPQNVPISYMWRLYFPLEKFQYCLQIASVLKSAHSKLADFLESQASQE